MRANVIASVGAGRPLPGFMWGRGGIFAMILSGFKVHITVMLSTCVGCVINHSLTLGAANNTFEHRMHYTHVVPIWKKGYKAAFTRLRAALLHALFSGAGE
jgi:hypothetical protein